MAKKKAIKKEVKKPVAKKEEAIVKEVKKESIKPVNGRIAKVDINLTYRKGDIVPQKQVDKWEDMGFDLNSMLE